MFAAERRTQFRILIATALGLIVVAVGAVGVTIWGLRSDAIQDASRETGNVATILAEQTSRSIQAIDLILGDVYDRVVPLTAGSELEALERLQTQVVNELLKERRSRLPQADVVALIDKHGKLLNTTRAWPAPATDVSDRDYFQHFKGNPGASLYVSAVMPNRVTGEQTIFFSKRLDRIDGEFAGVILIGLKLTHFQHIYDSITSLRDQSFLFLRRDGVILVRHPDRENRVGERMPPGSPWYELVKEGGGNYRAPGYFDGHARLVSVRPLSDYPLVVNVAYSETAALASWRRRSTSLAIGTFLTVLCSVLLLRALSIHVSRLLASEGSLAEREAKLADKSQQLETAKLQLDAAVNNMTQGLCMFDAEQRLIVCNRRYAEMYGLSPEHMEPGTTLRAILERRVATGNSPEDAAAYIEDRITEVSAGKPYAKENELRDGRIISVMHQPMTSGGWVAIHQDVTEQKTAEKKIAHMAHHDGLTELPNRILLREKVEQNLAYVRRGESLAILCLDLDHFKNINDTLGHPVGDALLRAVAVRLRECVRDTDVVARLGGDEFAIVQTATEQPVGATALAQRLIEMMSDPFDVDGHHVVIGTSVGIAIAPTDGEESDRLLKNADMALYRAKADGRNTFRFFEAEMDGKMQARRSLELDLRKALPAGEFELHYQPLINLKSNEVSGFEALLRWNHPTRGRVSPEQFIPLAEETGLIVPLGEWVLRQACLEAASWPAHINIAVNLSPVQFRNKTLVPAVVTAIASAGILPSRLEIEITEAVLLQNNDETIGMLHQLRHLGVRISMDDFGTGYSSLSYLRSFPFDKIKIDQSFVQDVPIRNDSIAIIRAVCGLAANLGMTTTAEGIETKEQLEQLRAEGCAEAQGYLFSRPCPASEIPRLLATLEKTKLAA